MVVVVVMVPVAMTIFNNTRTELHGYNSQYAENDDFFCHDLLFRLSRSNKVTN